MNRKSLLHFMTILMVTMLSMGVISCSKDNNEEETTMIPSGTYVEENGYPEELYTMVVNGNNIKITIYNYDKVEKIFECSYTISGNSITLYNKETHESESGYFSMNGNRVTIGEITYIKQQRA